MTAAFLTSLDVRILSDSGPRPRMVTLEPLHYQSDVVGTVVVPRFFTFDGASIPTPAMGVVGWPAVRAACVHDFLLDLKVARRTAAHAFREAMAVCGVDEGTAQIMYQAVRVYDRVVESAGREPDEQVGA